MASKLMDRAREFCVHGKNWDIKFDVGIRSRRIIKGHRILFEIGTPYFEQKFKAHFKNGGSGPVRIDVMEPEEFRKFQEFLYTHRTKNPFEDHFKMIQIAKELDVPDLVRHCVYKIEKTFIYDEAGLGNLKKSTINLGKLVAAFTTRQEETLGAVEKFLFHTKSRKVKEIMDPEFDPEEFKHMSGPLLMYILSHKSPFVSAINLFKAVERFVNMDYKQRISDLIRGGFYQQPQPNSLNLKAEFAKEYIEVLFPRLKLEISLDESRKTILESSILTDTQKSELRGLWFPGGARSRPSLAQTQQKFPVMSLNFPFNPSIPPPPLPFTPSRRVQDQPQGTGGRQQQLRAQGFSPPAFSSYGHLGFGTGSRERKLKREPRNYVEKKPRIDEIDISHL